MKLSHVLINKGWLCVLGTMEYVGASLQGVTVKQGVAYHFDQNNGVVVVYDEAGRPWISLEGGMSETIDKEFPEHYHLLQSGAYVPHSNDGGHFMRAVLPEIFSCCPQCGTKGLRGNFCSECGARVRPFAEKSGEKK